MRWILYPVVALFAAATVGFATLGTAIIFAWPKLPSLEVLTDYRPRIPMRIYSADGHLLGEFGEERRALVEIENVPDNLKFAILAAEDERFYEHPGVDVIGIGRAALANFVSGDRGQGASTITMQVARNFFLSRERTYNRKLYEMLLAFKIESNLSKDEILELYLNQIFLGHRAYGFSAASRTYFGRPLEELSLAQAAMLAGLPKAPSTDNPITSMRRATIRQHYVLRRMLDAGFIDQEEFDEARSETMQLVTGTVTRRAPRGGGHVAEMARRMAVEQFGDQAYNLGLRIITTIDYEKQLAAQNALRNGVLDYDRRHGYRGPEEFIDLKGIEDDDEDTIRREMRAFRHYPGLAAALVLEASPQEVRVWLEGDIITISGDGLSFAAPMLDSQAPQNRRVRRGAVIRVSQNDDDSWSIAQLPEVEGSLISLDPKTGAIQALAGGFDSNRGQFNHVTQAYRQPGSSFKPFIFSAALEHGFSPASYELDDPLYFPADVTGSRSWEPRNYDNRYDGPMTLREALARSRNMVSIRLLQSITPDYAQDYISRFGFEPQRNPAYLTMALGAGAATPWQMATGYAVFANGGFRVEPYIIQEITDISGRTLAKVDPPVAGENAPRVIDPRNAWLINSMLQDVITTGTGRRAQELNRSDVAGKTGTTNNYIDAWFTGYTPDHVAVSWLGYSQPRNLGRGESGGRAALPIWVDYMREALKDIPERELERPNGLLPIQHPGSDYTDYYYQEDEPPRAPPRELYDIPELRYFLTDDAWRTQDQPGQPDTMQLPPSAQGETGDDGITRWRVPGQTPPRDDETGTSSAPVEERRPAPVEDRSPTPVNR